MSRHPLFDRRGFLKQSLLGSTAILATWPALGTAEGGQESTALTKPLRFGIIADVHKDIMHDADKRLRTFVDHMTQERVDFVFQLGDFCIPKPENRGFLEIWNSFDGPRHHVLGNHDMDGGYQREQTVAYFGMPARYYSFDARGIHFVVLDGNDRPADHRAGYPRYIASDQLAWLREDLAANSLPTLVFVHQSLEREDKGGVINGKEVRSVFEEANRRAGFRKVLACFSGHHHRDYVRQIDDIVYPQINSASYFWVGGNYQKIRYGADIDKRFPNIKNTVPYRDPLFAIVTLDAYRGYLSIEGRRSEFVGPAPWELGETQEYWEAHSLSASVSDWKLPV